MLGSGNSLAVTGALLEILRAAQIERPVRHRR
jgi:hypothetical protein